MAFSPPAPEYSLVAMEKLDCMVPVRRGSLIATLPDILDIMECFDMTLALFIRWFFMFPLRCCTRIVRALEINGPILCKSLTCSFSSLELSPSLVSF